ncbi:MAG: glutamine-hydrolyzing GMP synthase [Bacteroidetes bacterium]|nr:glutamine-hydrolyzing GMP synthase [Bacteroidota bacterium]
MNDCILIIDFGSQYTQLIARRVRELEVYSEIVPYNNIPELSDSIKGIILSGSPFSIFDDNSPRIDLDMICNHAPVLGICYGAQLIAHTFSGEVSVSSKREYGKATLIKSAADEALLNEVGDKTQVWMSHADSVTKIPDEFEIFATTESIPVAGFKSSNGKFSYPVYGIQFHPEVTHSLEGKTILKNFVVDTCGCKQDWTPDSFVESTVANLKEELKNDRVILGLSGGVDSTVAAFLIDKAIGENLYCIFIDNGLLRMGEFEQVLNDYKDKGLHVIGVDAKNEFLDALDGVTDPEEKRKAVGKTFIEIFEQEANKLENTPGINIGWLAQGTIYPDVIESVSVHGPSATIKSHHNVGGLPEKMNLKIVEPLKFLFKDEVRKVGKAMNLLDDLLRRHPFPGPGLAIRIIGDVTEERIKLLQDADNVFINKLKSSGLYDEVWQAAVMLLPIQSVGVMGDERTYESVVCLRAVTSLDGMTAEWAELPHNFLAEVSNEIINNIKGINRVVYDISSKPPATIEWE